MPDTARILLGAMSGTSADGVDVAAVEIAGRGLEMKAKYLAHVEHPYDAELRRRVFVIRESGQVSLEELAKLGRNVTLAYVRATRELLKQMSLAPARVAGLAAHGQTLYHAPPDSIQWLDPSLLAAQTDMVVISDFRRADLAAGGQGAPLVPFADWILFRHPHKTRVILNIGGIANLTYLPAGGGLEDVVAFDTGPGMCLIDHVMRTRGGGGIDDGGRIAREGDIDGSFVGAYLREAVGGFNSRMPPKSTDVPEWIKSYEAARTRWLPRHHLEQLNHELATVTCIAESTISLGLTRLAFRRSGSIDEVLAAGGGTKNEELMREIASNAGRFEANISWPPPRLMDEGGLPGQAREAVAFAILGAATLDGEPSNVPSATGARRRVVLGSIRPRPGT